MPVGKFGERFSGESGTILMWGGLISDIPNGWIICDGNNGTPDLTDGIPRSVKSGDTNASGTGGSDSKSLSNSQIPPHSHGGSTGGSASHTHGISSGYADSNGSSGGPDGGYNSTSESGSHTHTVESYNSAGGESSFENRPSFIELAYIMKA